MRAFKASFYALLLAAMAPMSPRLALAQQPQRDCEAEIAKATKDILTFYPAPAKSAGLSGAATITCQGELHGAIGKCILVSETPTGEGFGKAALDIADATLHNPSITLTPEQLSRSQSVTLEFNASPPLITPNLLVWYGLKLYQLLLVFLAISLLIS